STHSSRTPPSRPRASPRSRAWALIFVMLETERPHPGGVLCRNTLGVSETRVRSAHAPASRTSRRLTLFRITVLCVFASSLLPPDPVGRHVQIQLLRSISQCPQIVYMHGGMFDHVCVGTPDFLPRLFHIVISK